MTPQELYRAEKERAVRKGAPVILEMRRPRGTEPPLPPEQRSKTQNYNYEYYRTNKARIAANQKARRSVPGTALETPER
jgi:hypothetical protein